MAVRYTRNGIFSLDNQRRLVTNLGHPVMGTKGEIKVPPGNIQINAEGAYRSGRKPIGTIKVVEFPDNQMPQKLPKGCLSGGSRRLVETTSPVGTYRRVERQFIERDGEDDPGHAS